MRRRESSFLRFLTSTLVASTGFVVIYVLVLLADPQSVLNPFPPPTLPAIAVLATPTETPPPPTVTQASTPLIQATVIEAETEHTPLPTETEAQLLVATDPIEMEASATVTIAVPIEVAATSPVYSYALQAGSIGYTTQFSHPDEGCNWLGVAGTVYDLQGEPVVEQIVHVEGPSEFWMDSITGSHLEYGEAGYEITLGNGPFDSDGDYSIQLLSSLGQPLSEQIALGTFSGCDRNLILVNFVQAE